MQGASMQSLFRRAKAGCLCAFLFGMCSLAHAGAATVSDTVGPGIVPPLSAFITDIRLHSTAAHTQVSLPITFGQIFAPGALKAQDVLSGRLPDGQVVPLQVDRKATHADGSLRHAIVSAILPSLAAGQTQTIRLFRTRAAVVLQPVVSAPTVAQLLAGGFHAELDLTVEGTVYRALAGTALRSRPLAWLAGPLVNEWLLVAPLHSAQGTQHPHLQVRFAVRAVGNPVRTRIDVTVENDWAYEPGPKNQTYDVALLLNGQQVYARTGLLHYHHARWHKTVWSSPVPAVDIRHNTAYLIASRAVPNYDQRIVIAQTALAQWQSGWGGPQSAPMGVGLATAYMPTTGGRQDIGILPAWSVAYLLSMDARAKDVMLGTADLAGSWPMHYRDRRTGRPVSLHDYPYMTLQGHAGDTWNPATKQHESFPDCAGDCTTPYTPDAPHQPSLAYLPYLVTGDYYYLEELQFWAMYDLLQSNPGYRDAASGLLKSEQIRGQAWSLRTVAQAAYITPDTDPLKAQLVQFLDNNLRWYNATYTGNVQANALHILTNGFAFEYDQGTGIAPWQDDFFTQAVGHVAELGFQNARALLVWKTRFAIGRMTDPQYCPILAPVYVMKVRDDAGAGVYSGLGQAYRASAPPGVAALPCGSVAMAAALRLSPGEMVGYADSATGFPANMQPALAYGADVGGAAGAAAWAAFEARKVKPDYSSQPQFAIVPR